jgi:AcrR family transcriptional regulator
VNKVSENSNNTEQKTYHHGNLRHALVEAFIDLLGELPSEKISMRKLATKVGVAPAAVYNHFTNKQELEIAVKVRCLNHFAKHLNMADATDPNPQVRIKNLGIAYFMYSRQHPEYFKLIMKNAHQDYPRTEELEEASMRAEEALRNCIIYLLESKSLPSNRDIEGLGAFACWSLSHGVSELAAKQVNEAACAAELWPPIFMMQSDESIDSCFDAMASILVSGIVEIAQRQSLKN